MDVHSLTDPLRCLGISPHLSPCSEPELSCVVGAAPWTRRWRWCGGLLRPSRVLSGWDRDRGKQEVMGRAGAWQAESRGGAISKYETQSEDCLHLNVFAPQVSSRAPLGSTHALEPAPATVRLKGGCVSQPRVPYHQCTSSCSFSRHVCAPYPRVSDVAKMLPYAGHHPPGVP